MRKAFDYRVELNGKDVEHGIVQDMSDTRAAARCNAVELHGQNVRLFVGHEGENDLVYVGTCHPDGTYTDYFGRRRTVDEAGNLL